MSDILLVVIGIILIVIILGAALFFSNYSIQPISESQASSNNQVTPQQSIPPIETNSQTNVYCKQDSNTVIFKFIADRNLSGGTATLDISWSEYNQSTGQAPFHHMYANAPFDGAKVDDAKTLTFNFQDTLKSPNPGGTYYYAVLTTGDYSITGSCRI